MSSRYPAEFKQKVVELVTIEHKSIAQVSLELNVSKPTLYYWLNNQGQGSRALTSERAVMDRRVQPVNATFGESTIIS